MSKDEPVLDGQTALAAAMAGLVEIMARLRDPLTGCPWDREQDFGSIAPYTVEEAYEVADAIDRGAWRELEGELGDLLLQVVYHARIGEERGLFDLAGIARGIADKMVRRHPHVFDGEAMPSVARQRGLWEDAKARERAHRGSAVSVLDEVPLALPALSRAVKLQGRAARIGFDWPDRRQVLAKVREELDELEAVLDGHAPVRTAEELGDLLFSVANLARHCELDPEHALRRGNAKFERRFRVVEERAAASGRPASLDELEALWQAAKRAEAAPQALPDAGAASAPPDRGGRTG